jgi:hypothetical protein
MRAAGDTGPEDNGGPHLLRKIYRHQLKPVMEKGAQAMDQLFSQKL